MKEQQGRGAGTAMSADSRADYDELCPVAYLRLSAFGVILDHNPACDRLLGIRRDRVVQRRFEQFVDERDKRYWLEQLLNIAGHPNIVPVEFDLLLIREDGSQIQVHCLCRCKTDGRNGRQLYLALVDITRAVPSGDDLRIEASAFNLEAGIFVLDAQKKILKVNRAFTSMTGYGNEEVSGQSLSRLFLSDHGSDFPDSVWISLAASGIWQGLVWGQLKNGRTQPFWLEVSASSETDHVQPRYVGKLNDQTQQNSLSAQVERLAYYDPLTNLPNRRLLSERLRQAIAVSARSKRQGALMFIDLDNFKLLNDTFGHHAGDQLLRQVAQRLVGSLRKVDTAARLGGDEFVVMLDQLSSDPEEVINRTKITGQKILTILNRPYRLSGCEYHCTPSIGVSLFGGQAVTDEDLLKQVDIAMYHAKIAGRNRMCFFDQNMQARLSVQTTMESDLRSAVNGQLRLFYQVQRAPDDRVIGAEILLRWQHPERGLLAASDFISVAQKTGLMLTIDRWVLEQACAQLHYWKSQPYAGELTLAVNIGARYFFQADFVVQVKTLLEQAAIDPRCLVLELSESMIFDRASLSIEKIKALNALGVGVCLDNFCMGNNSLALLSQMPFRQLKIDRSIINRISSTEEYVKILQIAFDIGKRLNMDVISQGVETDEQRKQLAGYGCPIFQGHLLGEPVTPAAFARILKEKVDKVSVA
ncbi:putative bifunctional diguanylate cyclase/phosphodiesterase [Methylomonas sp. MgM2]